MAHSGKLEPEHGADRGVDDAFVEVPVERDVIADLPVDRAGNEPNLGAADEIVIKSRSVEVADVAAEITGELPIAEDEIGTDHRAAAKTILVGVEMIEAGLLEPEGHPVGHQVIEAEIDAGEVTVRPLLVLDVVAIENARREHPARIRRRPRRGRGFRDLRGRLRRRRRRRWRRDLDIDPPVLFFGYAVAGLHRRLCLAHRFAGKR
ncbi:MAG: hypothetical protein C0484_04360 [Rhodospirillum sp.]|nr:hypothetical protein [Rhodospirillum sp.]